MDGIKRLNSEVYFIKKDIDNFLRKEGFNHGHFDDCYSGAKGKVLFYKRIGSDESQDSYTAIVTDMDEIAIEREYNYGSGESAGICTFNKNDEQSFIEAYNNFVDTVKGLMKNRGLVYE